MNYKVVTATALVRVLDNSPQQERHASHVVSEALAAKGDVVYIFSSKARDVEADEWAEYKAETQC